MYEDVTSDEVERRLAACHETVQAVTAYWRDKAGARLMPRRSDIDPADITPYLSAIILVDVVPDSRRFVYRLVGTREVAARGTDPTGRSVADAFYADSAEASLDAYEYVVRNRRPFCFRDPYPASDGKIEHEDIIYLPLSEDGESVNMILVYSHFRDFHSRFENPIVLR